MNERHEMSDDIAFLERVMRWQDGALNADELAAFDRELLASPDKRRLFAETQVRSMSIHERLRQDAYRPAAQRESVALRPWLQWRPLLAAAAGIVIGLFSASVVWAYAVPRFAAFEAKILPLMNGDFEGAKEPVANGIPTQFGMWSGDFTRVVGSEQGVVPRHGQRMVRVLRSDSQTDAPGQDSHGCDLMQLVDLRPFKRDFASGEMVLEVSAACAIAHAESGKRFRFAVQALAYSGGLPDFDGDPSDVVRAAIASGMKVLKFNGASPDWREGTARVLLPPEADFVMVKLTVAQIGAWQPGHVEFAGHYVDDVKLVLAPQPARAALGAKR